MIGLGRFGLAAGLAAIKASIDSAIKEYIKQKALVKELQKIDKAQAKIEAKKLKEIERQLKEFLGVCEKYAPRIREVLEDEA